MNPWLAFALGYYVGAVTLLIAGVVGNVLRKTSSRYPRLVK